LRLTLDGLRYQRENVFGRAGWVRPAIGVASWQPMSAPLPTDINSRIAGTLTNSSYRESEPRLRHAMANSALNPVGFRLAQAIVNGTNGFRYIQRFGFAAAPTSSHFFMGLVNTTGAFTSVHPPSSLVSGIVVGYVNSGLGCNLSIWRNNDAGNAVQLDMGSYFTVQTPAWYEFEVEVEPSAANWYYTLRRLDVASIAEARSYFSTDVPGNSLWLSPHMAGCTLATSGLLVENGGVYWEQ
jgi:hypothetical protein